jgi:hypothetical protein
MGMMPDVFAETGGLPGDFDFCPFFGVDRNRIRNPPDSSAMPFRTMQDNNSVLGIYSADWRMEWLES